MPRAAVNASPDPSHGTERRRQWSAAWPLALGTAGLAVGLGLTFGMASERTLLSGFETALATRGAPARSLDQRLSRGFDASAVRLSRHDSGGHDGGPVTAVDMAAAQHGRPGLAPGGVLDALTHTPRPGERIMVTSADGRVDALEVVSTAPLPSGFDSRAAAIGPDNGADERALPSPRADRPTLLLVTLRVIDAAERDGAPRLVRLILDGPAAPAAGSGTPRPKAL